jgi:Gas vesicle protein G
MGLITGLLTLPLAPLRGVGWAAQTLLDEAERELYDERRILLALAQLDAAREAGELDDATHEQLADELLERLEVSRGGA